VSKAKTKHKSVRLGCGEQVCLLFTVAGMFIANLFTLSIPVNVFTRDFVNESAMLAILIVLTMLSTSLSVHLYYRMLRWLEPKRPIVAVITMGETLIGFGLLCGFMAFAYVVTLQGAGAVIGNQAPFPAINAATLLGPFISPQLAILALWAMIISVNLLDRLREQSTRPLKLA
jgi:hypothetical protein